MAKGQRDLTNHTDKGTITWEEYISILSSPGMGSRLTLFLAKALDYRMGSSDGFIRVETWKEGNGDESTQYKADVRYDMSFLVWFFNQKFSELKWIDGAAFSRPRMEKLIDLIEDDHSKLKEKEVEKSLRIAAEQLVNVGFYSDIELALEFVRSANASESNGSSKAKGKAVKETTSV